MDLLSALNSDGLERSEVLGILHARGEHALREKDRRSLQLEQQITALFDQLRVPLYRYALSLGLPAGVADEIVQETFLRLFQHLHKKGREDNLRGWVFRVAHNLAMDSIKANTRIVSSGADEGSQLIESLASQYLGPEELLLHKERMQRVHAAMKTLSVQQGECLSLRSEGFRYRDIAEIMGISVHTVAEHLQRAMEKLTRGVRE